MDSNALAVLEYPAIVERLAGAASTPRGEELARGLLPSPDPPEVDRRQALTAEAIALLDDAAEPPLAGIQDVRGAAELATRDGVLRPADLRAVAVTIGVGLEARRVLHESAETAPLLAELVAPVDPGLATLADAIRRRVEDDGSDLRDNASPVL